MITDIFVQSSVGSTTDGWLLIAFVVLGFIAMGLAYTATEMGWWK